MIDTTPLFGSAQAPGSQSLPFRVFSPNGAARWLLDTGQSRPWHLKTWPRANLRARIIHRAAWTLGSIGLHLPHRVTSYSVAPESAYAQLRAGFDRLGVFLGTPGPNRKIVVYAGRADRSVFVKIPMGPNSAALIAHEAAALAALARDPDLVACVPAASTIAGHLAVEDVESPGVRHAALDLPELLRIHDLMQARSGCARPLAALRTDWDAPPPGVQVAHDARTGAALARVRAAANRWLDGLPPDLMVPCHMAHGDFTRWNVLRAPTGQARIIDWEMYGLKPRWFDPIHYVVSHMLLVERSGPRDILDRLARLGLPGPKALLWRQTGLYFACQSLYYSALYARQSDLYPQAMWQLATWAEALELLQARPSLDGGARP